MSRVAQCEPSGSRKLQDVSAVLRAVRAVTRRCLQESIQGLMRAWVERGLAGGGKLESPWRCPRCEASQPDSFRRNGSYRRQLSTMAGVITLAVPQSRLTQFQVPLHT